jgi:integrase
MSSKIPSLTRHATGMGCVRLDHVDYYSKGCTPWRKGCPAPADVMTWYERFTAEWVAAGKVMIKSKSPTLATIVAGYLKQARQQYKARPEEGNNEVENFKIATAELLRLYSSLPAKDFSPKKLKAVRQVLLDWKLARSTINNRIRRIKQIIAWAVEEELIPGTVHHALVAVKGLRKGMSTAREPRRVMPVPMKQVKIVYAQARPEIKAMILLQLRSGMRPAEVCRITPGQIDRSRKIWVYRPDRHKTENHDHDRQIYLGKRAQAILAPWLLRGTDQPCFTTAPPRKGKAKGYLTRSYRLYIKRVCQREKIKHWSPNQLRHNAGTRFRRKFGLEVSRVLLGHKKVETTQIYAEVDRRAAIKAMKQLG